MSLIRTSTRIWCYGPMELNGPISIPPEMVSYGATLLEDIILRNGAPVGHFDWTSAYVPKPPYNARNRRRWSDKLIPERRNKRR